MRRRPDAPRLLVAASCAVALTFVGRAASAFCREVTAPVPAGYDAVASGCFYPQTNPQTGGAPYFLYWPGQCVGYSLSQAASFQVSLDEATSLGASAFAAWSGAACPGGNPPSISAVNNGPSACGTVGYNATTGNQHVIVFRDDGWPYSDSSNTLGLTTLTVDEETGEIYDADMEINSHDFTLTVSGQLGDGGAVPAGTNGYDLLGILTHEAGHFLGLAHSNDPSAVMYAFYPPGAPLGPDDLAGICTLDGPDGTHATGRGGSMAAAACDPTPRNGFATDCAGLVVEDAGAGVAAASFSSTPPVMCPAASSACAASGSRPPEGVGLFLIGLAGAFALGRRLPVRRRRVGAREDRGIRGRRLRGRPGQ